ncbi:MAG: hypothetical protein ACK4F9_03975 [Brevinematia bacterium]
MKVLIIDTSYYSSFSVGLLDGKDVYSIVSFYDNGASFVIFWRDLERLLSLSSIGKTDIDFVSVSVGPGPFTSLRNGISVAKTFSQILNVPIIPFSLIEVLEEVFFMVKPTLIFDGRAKKILIKRFDSNSLELVKISEFKPSDNEFLISIGCRDIFKGVDKMMLNFDVVPIGMISSVVLKKLEGGYKKTFSDVSPIYYKEL